MVKDGDAPFVETSDEGFVCLIRKKEPEKKYVPFDLSKPEVRNKLRGVWIKQKEGFWEEKIALFCKIADGQLGANSKSAEELLRAYTFLDGTPCGELVEVEE